jgi:tRNA (Thr-GGU) A37 N-methylase
MTTEMHRESFDLNPIGYVESGYHSFSEVPHPHGKGGWNEDISTIALCPEHAGEISGLEVSTSNLRVTGTILNRKATLEVAR